MPSREIISNNARYPAISLYDKMAHVLPLVPLAIVTRLYGRFGYFLRPSFLSLAMFLCRSCASLQAIPPSYYSCRLTPFLQPPCFCLTCYVISRPFLQPPCLWLTCCVISRPFLQPPCFCLTCYAISRPLSSVSPCVCPVQFIRFCQLYASFITSAVTSPRQSATAVNNKQ